jgi:hypothetical protein
VSLPIDDLAGMTRRQQHATTSAPVHVATVMQAPATPGDDLYVVIPTISSTHIIGPCQWQPMAVPGGVRYPVAGDECAVTQDTSGRYWVIGWIPTTYTALPGT